MKYHISCFHNCFSEIVQNLSNSATFSKESLVNPSELVTRGMLFQMEKVFFPFEMAKI